MHWIAAPLLLILLFMSWYICGRPNAAMLLYNYGNIVTPFSKECLTLPHPYYTCIFLLTILHDVFLYPVVTLYFLLVSAKLTFYFKSLARLLRIPDSPLQPIDSFIL